MVAYTSATFTPNLFARLGASSNVSDLAAATGPDQRSWEQFRQGGRSQNNTNWEQLFEGSRLAANPTPHAIIQPSRAFTESVTVESAANQLHTAASASVQDDFTADSAAALPAAEHQQSVFQLHGRYIICQVKSGMMLIDQEAAHQRILYEKFLRQLRQGSAASQQALFPQQLQLSRQDMELLQEYGEEIRSLGFELSPFGGDSLVIQGVPADLAGVDSQRLLEGLLEQLKHHRADLSLGKREQTARALAVRAALRWGHRLELAEMRSLIDQLFACQTPGYTPDGQQTFRLLDLDKVAELFKS